MEEAVEITVFTALHNAGVAYEDFSPEQMDVIYSVAEAGGELEELLNPDFPPEQMQLIADVQNRTDAISRAAAEEALEPLTQQPMTPAEVNHARRQHNLPLDSGAETEQPAQPKQEPMNFRITDDDLGAGGPKTKYKANVEAIRVLQTLDAEQRQATAEEQEILSRYVGWGGIPQAFDENNAEWSKEYAELQSLLTTDEYKEARASTLNAFYTSPTVIKAMYEALGNMGLPKGNVLEPSCGVGNFMGLVPDSMEKIRIDNSEKNREYRCRSYEYQIQHGFMITADNYGTGYSGTASRGMGAEAIRKKMESINPDKFKIRKFGVSDVIGLTAAGKTSFFYVDKDRLVRFNGFFPKPQSGTYLILDEGGYQVAGQKGTWLVSDEVEVDGQRFVQMRSEQTKNPPPSIILHESGAFVTQTALGFDGEATRKMSAFLQGPKPELLHHQKFFENGTAERAKESGTEQNYNMIDGCVNNVPKKPRRIGGRWSVIDRLHIKQAERRQKDNAPQQEQERSRKS